MYWMILFFIIIIIGMALSAIHAKSEIQHHDWDSKRAKIDDTLISRMQNLACCPTTFYDSCDLKIIEKVYEDAQLRGQRNDFIPVLLVLEEELERNLLDQFGIKNGKTKIDIAKVMERRHELMQITESGKDWLSVQLLKWKYFLNAESPEFFRSEVMGEYATNGECITSFKGIINNETGRTLPLLLAEVPVKQPWEVLSWFPVGGFNECPKAEHIISVAKYWYEEHGAIPSVIAMGIIEFTVPKPISDDESIPLAEEQYAFCHDIVDQGFGSINTLADVLRKSTIWFFGWE